MTIKKEKIAKDMIINTIGNLVYCICQWVMTILVVRFVSYKEAGYLSLAMSTSSTFSTISHFSMRNFQVSDINNEFSVDEYVGSRIATCLLALVTCFVYAINSTDTYQMICIDAFMIIRIIEGFVDVFHGVDQKSGNYEIIGKSCLYRGIASLVGFLFGLIVFKNTFLAIAITALFNALVFVFYDVFNTIKMIRINPIIWNNHIKKLLAKCFPLVICTFLFSAIPLIAKTTLQNQYGTELLGIYSSISSPTIVVQIVASYAFSPLLPHISDSYSKGRYTQIIEFIKKMLLFFLGFSLLIIVCAFIFGKLGLSLLYGSSILDYYDLFIPIVLCTLMTSFIYVFISIATAFRMQIEMIIGISISFVIAYAFKNPIIARYSANGVSIIHVMSYLIILIWLISTILIKCIYENKRRIK